VRDLAAQGLQWQIGGEGHAAGTGAAGQDRRRGRGQHGAIGRARQPVIVFSLQRHVTRAKAAGQARAA
jgi:hypothetical protein